MAKLADCALLDEKGKVIIIYTIHDNTDMSYAYSHTCIKIVVSYIWSELIPWTLLFAVYISPAFLHVFMQSVEPLAWFSCTISHCGE